MGKEDVWREYLGALSDILVRELPKNFNEYELADPLYLDKEGAWFRRMGQRHDVLLSEADIDSICNDKHFLYHFRSEENGTQLYALYKKKA